MIYGNMVGGASQVKTYLLEFEDGTTVPAVMVDTETVFTATANDIREGSVAATDAGVTTGTKFIPPYFTSAGYKVIVKGREFNISFPERDAYDYTAFQAIICPFNTSMAKSVAAEKVVIEDNVYLANSTESISTLSKDADVKSIKLGIANDSDKNYIVRYFTYRGET